jgi:hypothetical protein
MTRARLKEFLYFNKTSNITCIYLKFLKLYYSYISINTGSFLFRFIAPGLQEVADFRHEVGGIGKMAIYGGKTDISHFVPVPQLVHNPFPDPTGGNFPLTALQHLPFQFIQELFDDVDGNGALLTSLLDALGEFGPLVWLPPSIFLDNEGYGFLHLLIGGKAPLALETLPAPPDGVGFPAGAGVNYLVLGAVAERAAHGKKL